MPLQFEISDPASQIAGPCSRAVQAGAALVIALTLLVVVSLLGVSALKMSTTEIRMGAATQQIGQLAQGADSLMEEAYLSLTHVTGSGLSTAGGTITTPITIDSAAPVFSRDCDPEASTVNKTIIGRGPAQAGWGVEFEGVYYEVETRCVARDDSTNAADAEDQPALTAFSGEFRRTTSGGGIFIEPN